eukprot:TRINITY_DN3897_c0_g3_i1.p1 TRINITY_DN3897_c0_g3~~TRINITY_DN3897_c0_g3_i1.p1  ORF type:complete len:171 (-),score=39.34 TRINITY_DN3897_c0_g3_i1:119-631(-)
MLHHHHSLIIESPPRSPSGTGGSKSDDDILDADGEASAKQARRQKQSRQKKIVVNFIKAVTNLTQEAQIGLNCSQQKHPPLDKKKLLELFQKSIKVLPVISPSVFWKYTKREVYANKEIHRNRKTGGYKGLSGVQFRQPSNPDDLQVMEKKLEKLDPYLAISKEIFFRGP